MAVIIAIAIARRTTDHSRYALLIIIGLICSLAGDVFLMLPSDQFIAGLSSFLIGHVFYIIAFRTDIHGLTDFDIGLPIYAVGLLIYWALWPMLGEMTLPVLVYMAVIMTMAWQSVVRWRRSPNDLKRLSAVVGAILFVMSDTTIAFTRFRGRTYLADGLIMSTYFAAQWLIAVSI
jgi:uncharacterized membrane protein YhhN